MRSPISSGQWRSHGASVPSRLEFLFPVSTISPTRTPASRACLEKLRLEIWSNEAVLSVQVLFTHFPWSSDVVRCAIRTDGRGRSDAGRIEERRWTVTVGNTSSPSPWSLIDGRTRERHGGRTHANTCYEQQVRARPSPLSPPPPPPHPPHLLFPLAASFPLSFSSGRDAASVWQDWQVARSFRSARLHASNRSSRTRQAERKRNRERAQWVAAGPLGGLQTSRVRQIQLTRTELESKESVRQRTDFLSLHSPSFPHPFRSSCSEMTVF